MTVGITIAVLLNNAPDTGDWHWRSSRDSSTTTQTDEKIQHLGSPEGEDQKPNVKLEETESIFKLEDSKTWFTPAGVPNLKLPWPSPSDSLRQKTVKEETPELDRVCPTDFGSQTPELHTERLKRPNPDTRSVFPIVIKEETEEANRTPGPPPHAIKPPPHQIYTPDTSSSPIPRPSARRAHHRRKSWPCRDNQCEGVFTNKRLYERHLSRDHRYKSTVCSDCGKTLGRKDYMTDHVRSRRHRIALDAKRVPKREK
ncbi:hypothetical protein TWF281_007500 [Arthrobotrys megalospora]